MRRGSTSDRGFLLNGRSVKLKGVCLHHDGGCVGAAVPEAVVARRLATLKGLGCNAIRCSHNPPAPEMLDLCDRMGFLVIDEAFDKWEGNGDRDAGQWYMRQRGFSEWWPRELASMLAATAITRRSCSGAWATRSVSPARTR